MDRKERRGYYEGRMEKYSRQYMDQGCAGSDYCDSHAVFRYFLGSMWILTEMRIKYWLQ